MPHPPALRVGANSASWSPPPYFTLRRKVAKVRLDEYDALRRTVADFIVRLKSELGKQVPL